MWARISDPSILLPGAIHLEFQASGNHYVWRKSTSTVHNIIVGKLWIDQVRGTSWRRGCEWPGDRPPTTTFCYQTGDIEIVNHKTKDRCQLKFLPYSYFSKEVARKVSKATSEPWRADPEKACAYAGPANVHR